jgi:hypothetical protein
VFQYGRLRGLNTSPLQRGEFARLGAGRSSGRIHSTDLVGRGLGFGWVAPVWCPYCHGASRGRWYPTAAAASRRAPEGALASSAATATRRRWGESGKQVARVRPGAGERVWGGGGGRRRGLPRGAPQAWRHRGPAVLQLFRPRPRGELPPTPRGWERGCGSPAVERS